MRTPHSRTQAHQRQKIKAEETAWDPYQKIIISGGIGRLNKYLLWDMVVSSSWLCEVAADSGVTCGNCGATSHTVSLSPTAQTSLRSDPESVVQQRDRNGVG